jgi:hypothetical protein
MVNQMGQVLQWLRIEVLGRKWLVIVILVVLVLVVIQIGVTLLPHHVLKTFSQFEEKSNGISEVPHGLTKGR